MKVSDLIEQLSKYPKDMDVLSHNRGDYGDELSEIYLFVEPVFIDRHKLVCLAEDIDDEDGYTAFDVLIAYQGKIHTNDLKSTLITSDEESV